MSKHLRWLVVALLAATASCDQRAMFDRLVPKDDAAFAIRTFAQLRAGEYEAVEMIMAPPQSPATLRPGLESVAAAFRNEEPKSVKVIGAFTSTFNGTKRVNLTLEYQLSEYWLLASIALHYAGQTRIIDGLAFESAVDSQENLNRFVLRGKGVPAYLMLIWVILTPIFIVVALVLLRRTPIPHRKWLWYLFVGVGLGQVTFNWTTQQFAFAPAQAQLLGAGFFQGIYGPLILMCSFPVGAIVFLARRGRWLNTAAHAPVDPAGI